MQSLPLGRGDKTGVIKYFSNPGDNLYKYQLIRKIGGGNFGEVWLAHDVTISKEVAVKILDESMAPVAENLKQAQLGHLLEHQNVVHVHYADIAQVSDINVVIIAMDFHPRGSTVGMLNPSNFLSMINSKKIAIDILRGLEYLHEQGLYHNDIKPSNILVGPHDEGILTDYGISCLAPNLQPTQAQMHTFFIELRKRAFTITFLFRQIFTK